jgi:putative DNA primase/helicase
MITTLSPVAYDDTAKAPTWVAFLDATFSSDYVMTAFVQRLAGSWLAGENREQILAVFHGVGANAKSSNN